MGALAHAVRSGKALYGRLSNYGPELTARAAHLLRGARQRLSDPPSPNTPCSSARPRRGPDSTCCCARASAASRSARSRRPADHPISPAIPADSRAGRDGAVSPPRARPPPVCKKITRSTRWPARAASRWRQTRARLGAAPARDSRRCSSARAAPPRWRKTSPPGKRRASPPPSWLRFERILAGYGALLADARTGSTGVPPAFRRSGRPARAPVQP